MHISISSPKSCESLDAALPNARKGSLLAIVIAIALAFGLMFTPGATGRLLQGGFVLALLVASWVDTKTRLIPNRLTYPWILCAVAINLFASLLGAEETAGLVGVWESLKGLGLCFALMLLLFLSNATGGGDVKLAAAIGAVMGPQDGLMSIAWCHILAGAMAIVWALTRLNFRTVLRQSRSYLSACWAVRGILPVAFDLRSLGRKRIPMAAFFALGVLLTQIGLRLW